MNLWPLFVGPIVGLCAFGVGLVTLEGALMRPDSTGISHFNPASLVQYIKLPFDSEKAQFAWGTLPGISFTSRMKLWNLNWVVMVGVGTVGALGYYYYTRC